MPAEIRLRGVVIIVGNYGSGKTEVTINLAADQRLKGSRVRVADLDLVNPYFRTREARRALGALGVDVILPPEDWLQADLPILAPQVAGLIRQPGELALLDAGGDAVGATVLASLGDAFAAADPSLQMLQVVNPFRPNTADVEQCLSMCRSIEAASRLKVTGWIGNAHMMDESTADHIHQGYLLMRALAETSGLPLVCMTVAESLAHQAASLPITCPLLTIRRQLVPPWRKPAALHPVE
ncbi:MAG: cobalamin biosynthesis protein CbiA [Desulfobacteraceae bacterium]|nr:MAG: cobalamin biosynthesis protein CbiA [Desulfobacteraceae bacterium]